MNKKPPAPPARAPVKRQRIKLPKKIKRPFIEPNIPPSSRQSFVSLRELRNTVQQYVPLGGKNTKTRKRKSTVFEKLRRMR